MALAASLILLGTQAVLAAEPAPQRLPTDRASAPAQRLLRVHKHARAARHSTLTAQTATQTATQAAHSAASLPSIPARPKAPDWPVNNPPRSASIAWSGHGLQIEADNSSLKQILNRVSTDTGATVQGLSTDERIFGSYGPGQVRDVLAQLLDGSGYNVMIVGGQDRATPLRIVLSAPPKGNASPVPSNPAGSQSDDSDAEEPPPPPPPQPPIRNGLVPNMVPRTPQQMMQELQQRQQEIEQQQEEMRQRGQQQN